MTYDYVLYPYSFKTGQSSLASNNFPKFYGGIESTVRKSFERRAFVLVTFQINMASMAGCL